MKMCPQLGKNMGCFDGWGIVGCVVVATRLVFLGMSCRDDIFVWCYFPTRPIDLSSGLPRVHSWLHTCSGCVVPPHPCPSRSPAVGAAHERRHTTPRSVNVPLPSNLPLWGIRGVKGEDPIAGLKNQAQSSPIVCRDEDGETICLRRGRSRASPPWSIQAQRSLPNCRERRHTKGAFTSSHAPAPGVRRGARRCRPTDR